MNKFMNKRENSHSNFYISNSNIVKSKRSNSRFTFGIESIFTKSKRSQITIIIIISIITVIAILSTAYVISENKKIASSNEYFSQAEIKPTIESIKSSIIGCAKETSEKALDKIGVQGGYYKKQNEYFDLKSYFIPYYYYLGDYFQTNKIITEKELNYYVNENLENCLKEINYPDYKLLYKIPRTEVIINEKEIIFQINQQYQIEREKNTILFELSDYPQKISSELNSIINLADYITESHKQDPAMYCISCVVDLAEKNNLYVDIINFRENEMLIIISENHTSSTPYSFEFLNKYTGNEKSPLTEITIQAPNIPNKE